MLKTVLEFEPHLISPPELDTFEKYGKMSCTFVRPNLLPSVNINFRDIDNARYLLIRLSLRKLNKWHRLSSLRYHSEMGDTDCITSAIRELSWNAEEQARMDAKSKEMETEKEIIDLTLDEDDDDTPIPILNHFPVNNMQPVASTSSAVLIDTRMTVAGPTPTSVLDCEFNGELGTKFADDESKMSLQELLGCLTTPELRDLARQVNLAKIKSSLNVCTGFIPERILVVHLPDFFEAPCPDSCIYGLFINTNVNPVSLERRL
jgi:fanconi-associated nuclease 1